VTNLLAQVALAVNYCHPFSHLLIAKMRMDQELAADCLAAPLVGGRQIYLESLAKLALRRVDTGVNGPALAFLPARRSFVRRLEMLRSVRFQTGKLERHLARLVSIGLCAAALGITAIRPSLAQQKPVTQTKSESNVAPLVSFVPDELAAMIVDLQVAKLLAIPELAKLANDAKFEPLPIRTDAIEQVVIMWAPEMFMPGVIPLVRLKAEVPADESQLKLGRFLRLDARTFCLVDPQSPEAQRISGKGTSSELAKLLDRHVGDPVRIAFRTKPILPLLENVPPQVALLSPLWRDVSTGSLALNMGETLKMMVLLDCTDPKVVSDSINAAMTLSKNAIQLISENPGSEEHSPSLKKSLHELVESVQVSSKNNQVTVNVSASRAKMLTAFAAPAVTAALVASDRTKSMNNLKQILLALHNYHDAHGHFPPSVIVENGIKRSWRVEILPYLEQAALYNAYHKDEAWDGPNNKVLSNTIVPIYANPRLKQLTNKTGIRAIGGPNGMLSSNQGKGIKLEEILDGASSTIAVVEVDKLVSWAEPDEFEATPTDLIRHGLGEPGIFLAGFGDGAVRVISDSVDVQVLSALLTRAGGEVETPVTETK